MKDIIQVVPRCDNRVYVYDEDGTVYLYDANFLVNKNKVLQNQEFFINRCTILNNTLAWDITGNYDESNCIDISPEKIFSSPIVKEKEVFEYVEQHKEELKERLSL